MIKAPSPEAHWRDSARYPRFFIVDARAAFPVVFCLVHIRPWTIAVAIVATLFFAALNRYGFTVTVFGRWLRAFLAGKKKTANPWWTR